MIRLSLGRLLHDRARSLFLVATLLLSVLSFLVLGASAKTSHVKTTGTVLGAPAAYDLIVRPPASITTQERTTRLVRANYLSGVYGGITLAQWRTIQKAAGVQTAAPIAMVGQVFERAFVPVDLTAYIDKKTTTVLRFTSTDHSRGGTASTPGPNGYLMVGPKVAMKQDSNIVREIGDRQVKWCPELDYGDYSQHGPLTPDNQLATTCTDVAAGEPDLPSRTDSVPWPHGTGHYVAYVPVTLPVTIAAIDPASEQAMVGLDDAITKGKNLTGQKVIDDQLRDQSKIPVLSATHLDVADDLTVDVSRLEAPSVTKLQTGDLTPRQSIDLVRTRPTRHDYHHHRSPGAHRLARRNQYRPHHRRACRPGDHPPRWCHLHRQQHHRVTGHRRIRPSGRLAQPDLLQRGLGEPSARDRHLDVPHRHRHRGLAQ